MSILKAVIYLRVSTDEQAEKGTSLETQELACRQRADTLQAIVAKVVRDEGVSGAFYASRSGIQEALAEIEAANAQVLIVYSISRLSRDTEHQQVIKKRVEQAGGRLIVCDMPMEDTAEGDLMFGISGAFAQYERKVIRKRTMTGRRQRAEEGQQPSRTQSPFGYHIVITEDVIRGDYPGSELGKYQVIEEQASIVRELFRRCASGTTLRQLSKWMQEQGVPTQRGGKAWHGTTIRYLLMNPAYKGTPYFGRRQWRSDESRIAQGKKPIHWQEAPESDWVALQCEPLVDVLLWEQCQERLAENQKMRSGPTARKYLLSGLLRCPKCDRAMRSANSKRGGLYYTCVEGSQGRSYSGTVCTNKYHRADAVEHLVLHTLMELSHRPERFANALRVYHRQQGRPDAENTLRQKLYAEIQELTQREQATATAQVQAMTQGRETAVYDRLLMDIDTRRRSVQSQLKTLEASAPMHQKEDFTDDGEWVSEVLRRVNEVMCADELIPAEKSQLLSTVIKRIIPDDNGYLFEMRPSSFGSQVASSVQMISIHWEPGASR